MVKSNGDMIYVICNSEEQQDKVVERMTTDKCTLESYEVWEDMFHAWHGCSHILAEAKEAIQNIGKFCTETLSIQ